MNNDELKDQAKKVAADAAGVARESIDKARKFFNQTFAEQNIASAKKVVREELESLKTAEGRGKAKQITIAKMAAFKSRVMEMWKSGVKGKSVLIASIIVLILIVKSCLFSGGQDAVVTQVDGTDEKVERVIERCKYCFHERLQGAWEQPPSCVKGRGHVYENIGSQGSRHFGCTKCGRHYYLQYEPRGYIDCPRGGACNWREL